jgi:hypothetical protein
MESKKGKVHPCTGTEALYRPYGEVHSCTGTKALYRPYGKVHPCTGTEALYRPCGKVQPCTGTEALYRPYGKVHPCTGTEALYRGSRGIALPFHGHSTRWRWGVSITPRPLFTRGKNLLPIVQEAGWASGPVWTGAENLATTGIRSPDRPAHSHSLYHLSYRAHSINEGLVKFAKKNIWKMFFILEYTFFINIDSHQFALCFRANSVLIPFTSVPSMTPECTSMCHLERLNEEHVGTAMTADWFLYS